MKASKQQKLFINGRFLTQPITGVQRYARELVLALDEMLENQDEAVANLEIILLSPRETLDDLSLRHIKHRKIGKFSGHLWEQLVLPFYARGGVLFCGGNTAPMLSLLSFTRVVTTVHDLSYLYFPDAYSRAFRALYRLLMPLILHFSNSVITVSKSERRSILKHYPNVEPRLHAIQNGGLAGRFLEQLADSNDTSAPEKPYFLYLGSLNRRKNPQGVIAAMTHLSEEWTHDLVIVGASSSSFQQGKFKIPDEVEGRVQFQGQINETERLIAFYKNADALLFPSFYEASPLPPIEAMACGCPVIAARIPSLEERCGDAALYCDPHASEDLAARIEQLMHQPGLRDTLSKAGLAHAAQYTWQICATKTMEIIQTHLK